jgi:alkanesulfonate monooxygenase SsuD/methylene tetrahydromethanopterin reductase-like flavin-dependent oxidoreductase (luciferase family)
LFAAKALAQQAEATGFDSLWVSDHLILDFGDSDRPRHGVWECWSILTSLAAVTARVELGTTVVCTSFQGAGRVNRPGFVGGSNS